MSDNSGFVQAQGFVRFGALDPADNAWVGIGVESITEAANVVTVILQNGVDPAKTAILVTPAGDLSGIAAPGAPIVRVENVTGGFDVTLVNPADAQPTAIAGGFWFQVLTIPRDVQVTPVL